MVFVPGGDKPSTTRYGLQSYGSGQAVPVSATTSPGAAAAAAQVQPAFQPAAQTMQANSPIQTMAATSGMAPRPQYNAVMPGREAVAQSVMQRFGQPGAMPAAQGMMDHFGRDGSRMDGRQDWRQARQDWRALRPEDRQDRAAMMDWRSQRPSRRDFFGNYANPTPPAGTEPQG